MPYYKLFCFVPLANAAQVKAAAFKAGAGRLAGSQYDSVGFVTRGMGQFRPLKDAKPHIGTAGGEVEYVEEEKIEIYCDTRQIAKDAYKAMKEAHPYEEAVIDIVQMLYIDDL